MFVGITLAVVGIAWGVRTRSQYLARHTYETMGRPEVREAVANAMLSDGPSPRVVSLPVLIAILAWRGRLMNDR